MNWVALELNCMDGDQGQKKKRCRRALWENPTMTKGRLKVENWPRENVDG